MFHIPMVFLAHDAEAMVAIGLGALWLAVLLSGVSKWLFIAEAIKKPGLWSFRLIVVDLLTFFGSVVVVIAIGPENDMVMIGMAAVLYFCLVIPIYKKLISKQQDPSIRAPRLLVSTAFLPAVVLALAFLVTLWLQ